MHRAFASAFLLAPGLAFAGPVDSLFCQGSQSLAVRGATGATLQFEVSLWTERGQYFGVDGTAEAEGAGWVYTSGRGSADPAERCAVRLTPVPGGMRFETADNARCEAMGGFGAAPYRPVIFPAASRVGTFAPVGAEDPVPPGC